MWNWSYEESQEFDVSLDAIWQSYQDVASWPKWDSDLDWAVLDGPFAEGVTGRLKPKHFFPVCFTLEKVKENSEFVDVSKMPLMTTCTFYHKLEKQVNGQVKITHGVKTCGFLAPLLRLTLKKQLKRGLLQAIKALVVQAKP